MIKKLQLSENDDRQLGPRNALHLADILRGARARCVRASLMRLTDSDSALPLPPLAFNISDSHIYCAVRSVGRVEQLHSVIAIRDT